MDGTFVKDFAATISRPSVTIVHEDDEKKIVAVATEGETTVIRDIGKLPVAARQVMQSVDGVLGWLNDNRVKKTCGMIFVGPEKIEAVANYGGVTSDIATLLLENSEELDALNEIVNGVKQEKLWHLLSTQLEGAIDVELALMISQVRIQRGDTQGLQVAESSGSREGAASWRIQFAAADGTTLTTTMRKAWKFTGRIFEAMSETYEIDLTLMIDGEARPPVFSFHPKKLADVERQARADVVKRLKEGVKPEEWSVVEGIL